MCIVLFHSTMEERLVQMVESKLINQSINQCQQAQIGQASRPRPDPAQSGDETNLGPAT